MNCILALIKKRVEKFIRILHNNKCNSIYPASLDIKPQIKEKKELLGKLPNYSIPYSCTAYQFVFTRSN